jgi:hypothetical protein
MRPQCPDTCRSRVRPWRASVLSAEVNAKLRAFVEENIGRSSLKLSKAAAKIMPGSALVVMANNEATGSNEPGEHSFDRLQIKRCSNVSDYPAGAAFSRSAYKIYAVWPSATYKSNIYFEASAAGDDLRETVTIWPAMVERPSEGSYRSRAVAFRSRGRGAGCFFLPPASYCFPFDGARRSAAYILDIEINPSA